MRNDIKSPHHGHHLNLVEGLICQVLLIRIELLILSLMFGCMSGVLQT